LGKKPEKSEATWSSWALLLLTRMYLVKLTTKERFSIALSLMVPTLLYMKSDDSSKASAKMQQSCWVLASSDPRPSVSITSMLTSRPSHARARNGFDQILRV
jgi:hypothetical protein